MKTFLWCDSRTYQMQYEFIAVNAENLEDAIKFAKAEIEAERVRDIKRINEFYQGRTDEYAQPPAVEKKCREEADYRLKALMDDPMVLESGQAKIIDHSNE